jgi:hypothetical protein
MSSREDFLIELYNDFATRRHCKYELNHYFYNLDKQTYLEDKAASFGLYFWVHINFSSRQDPSLRVGNIKDRESRGLFEDSSEESSTDSTKHLQKFGIFYKSKKTEPPKFFDLLDDIASVDGSEISSGSFLDDLEYLDDISVESTPSVLEPITLGSSPEFAITIVDSTDEETCAEF